MAKNRYLFNVLCVLLFLSIGFRSLAAEPYTIGTLEGGRYWLFSETLEAIKRSLSTKGWSEKISFPVDAQFSPGWDHPQQWDERAQELMGRDDLNLIIAMGTDATRALLKANNHTTPIIALAVSDPISAGFIPSIEDSGMDNFTVRLDPERYPRMFQVFHQIFEFKKLGLIYPNTESGRQFTSLDAARTVAARLGFEIVEYDKLTNESTEDCLAGIDYLIQQNIDAFFIPSLVCFDWQQSDVNVLLSHLRNASIPTFARNGSQDVQRGALMGFSTMDFSGRGQFLAQMIIDILEGASPRSLTMLDTSIPKISFNLAVAYEIGINPSFDILAMADELYQDIILPENRRP